MTTKHTKIVYLIGRPGTGKYTIATELAKRGFKICDNQLVNMPVFALIGYDGTRKTHIPGYAWKAIEGIRNSVFDYIAQEPHHDYVLTNVLYETEYDHKIFQQVQDMADKRGSLFVPVRLRISVDENARRIQSLSRRERHKTIDVKDIEESRSLIDIVHPNLLDLEVTTLTAQEAANAILAHAKGCR